MSALRETLRRLSISDLLKLLRASFICLLQRKLATPDDYSEVVGLLNQITHDDQAA